jgi:hypothetical protein
MKKFLKPYAPVIAYIFLLGGVWYGLITGSETATNTQNLAHNSAVARVHTVEQRCELTKTLRDGIPMLSVKLGKSYKKCESQLVEVKKLAGE